jgi:hypothetical protein
MKSALERLEDWYSRHCDGDWEHLFGFEISTLDNPGVAVDIDLVRTALESVPFEEKKVDYDSVDRWMICKREDEKFVGRGAPGRLNDIIEEFLRWAELHEKEADPDRQRTTRGM